MYVTPRSLRKRCGPTCPSGRRYPEYAARRSLRALRAQAPCAQANAPRLRPQRGVFEISGPLQYVFAVGQIPGGQFQPVDIVCKGHLLYLFEGEGCRKPTSKPRGFFNIKRAEVTFIGLLQNPPLPPFTNVFKLTFASKQMAHKDWFFKAKTNREVNQWVADLSWRVKASEAQIDERFEPRELTDARLQKPRRLMDETETAVTRPPTQVLGFLVRYEPKAVAEEVEEEDEEEKQREILEKRKAKRKAEREKQLLMGGGRKNVIENPLLKV